MAITWTKMVNGLGREASTSSLIIGMGWLFEAKMEPHLALGLSSLPDGETEGFALAVTAMSPHSHTVGKLDHDFQPVIPNSFRGGLADAAGLASTNAIAFNMPPIVLNGGIMKYASGMADKERYGANVHSLIT